MSDVVILHIKTSTASSLRGAVLTATWQSHKTSDSAKPQKKEESSLKIFLKIFSRDLRIKFFFSIIAHRFF